MDLLASRIAALAAALALFLGGFASAAPLTGVTAISAGGGHSCAVTGGGAVQCWGDNQFGMLGDGTTNPSAQPVTAVGVTASAVKAGGAFTCAIVAGGAVKCWGNNAYGQVGDGTQETRLTAVDVVGLAGVTDISASNIFNCAVTAAAGVKCWGWIGNTPVDVAGLTSSVADVSAGNLRNCVATTGGGAKCWAWVAGEPNVFDVAGASGIVAVSAGSGHQCMLTAAGGVQCMGNNSQGQLGDGTDVERLSTLAGVSGLASGVASIDAGYAHTCAVTTTGGLKCWGDNSLGQLGDGTTTNRAIPVDVVGLASGVASVSAGLFHTCAVLQSGEARCWGANNFGQLGRGTAGGFTTVPAAVGTFAAQAITFDPLPARIVDSPPFGVAATASSGLAVTFRSLTPGVCAVNGWTVTVVAAGICSVGANQPGDSTYGIAPEAVRSFLVVSNVAGAPGRLANISARARVEPGTRPLIMGVVVGAGSGLGSIKTNVFRARAPSLAAFGIPDPLANPLLQIYFDGNRPLADNNDWQVPGNSLSSFTSPPSVLADIGMAPSDSLESAILTGVGGGAYTAVVEGAPGATAGVAIGEIFEIDNPSMRILNLSARGWVGVGNDVMIGGFVIGGDSPVSIVVRARGPSLVPFGIADALANPTLTLVRSSDQTVLSINNDWEQAQNASQILASGYAPSDPLESAILITLTPGAYTAIVSGVGNTSGVGIVEVFAP